MARKVGAIEQLVRTRFTEHPDAAWLLWGDEKFTWRDVVSASQRAANGLLELGVRPGDRVAILLRNRPEFIWVHLGIQMIGASSVPTNISQRGVTLAHVLRDSNPTAIVLDGDLLEPIVELAPELPNKPRLVVADRDPGKADMSLDRLLEAEDREPPVDFDQATGAVGILYTSGTTGPPKGVVADDYDLNPIEILLDSADTGPDDVMYTGLPLYHGNALAVSMLGSIMRDAKLALAPKFTASGFLSDLRRFNATQFNVLGGMVSILLKQPERPDDADNPARVVLSAGCPANCWERFEQRFGVRLVEWFGMVDSPGILLNEDGVVGSMGRSGAAGIDFDVFDENDSPAGPDVIGELVFKHPRGRLTHYHGLPEATERAYRNGWFHSGDLAHHDADGYFYYRGRKTESIRRLGENISAWEIETVLNQHPQVLDSAAHSVSSELGEDEVKVVVVPKEGETIDPEELLEFCDGRMSKHAIPRYVEFVDALPKTPSERNQYGTLKARGITAATWDREGVSETPAVEG